MEKTYQQLSHLSNEDLQLICITSRKLLSERGVKIPSCSNHLIKNKKTYKPKNLIAESFKEFISDDWSEFFKAYDCERKDYYVYMHLDPSEGGYETNDGVTFTGTPFYIGKGTGKRAYSKNRAKPHTKLINGILYKGYKIDDICYIFKDGLNEQEAMELESKIINYFGCRSELHSLKKPHFSGEMSGILINSDTGVRPDWVNRAISSNLGLAR